MKTSHVYSRPELALRRLGFLFITSLLLLAGSPALFALGLEAIYFAEFGANRINRMNPDGTGVTSPFPVQNGVDELDVDTLGGKVYWTNLNEQRVRRSNLDGTNIEDIAVGQPGPVGIALDLANGHVYWANFGGPIRRANLDGTNQVTLFNGSNQPDGIALDLVNGHIYVTNRGLALINRANLDGTNVQNLTVSFSGLTGISVDPGTQKIYFGSNSTPGLYRLNYDGTGQVNLIPSVGVVGAVSIDLENGHLYFGGNNVSAVLRADLDGTNLITLAPNRSGVFGIGLLQRVNRTITAAANAAPGVSGATFRSFTQPVANRTGRVAFTAKMSGSVTTANDSGIWSTLGTGALSLVVQEGGPTTVPDVNIKAWSALHITDSHLFFRAKLAGAAVASTSDDALCVWNGTTLTLLAREGDPSPAGGVWGPIGVPTVNDAGQVLFKATYVTPTGNGTGLFRSGVNAGTIETLVQNAGSVDLDGAPVAVKSFTATVPNAAEQILAGNGYTATVLKLADGRTVLAVLAQ